MDKLEGKQLEEYLQIVVDVQKNYLLLSRLEKSIDESKSDLEYKNFMHNRAIEANNSVVIKCVYYILLTLITLIVFAETTGPLCFWIYFIIEIGKEGFRSNGYLFTAFLFFVLIGWAYISFRAWCIVIKANIDFRKIMKALNSFADDYSANNSLSKSKEILFKLEVNDLKELCSDWLDCIRDYWNSESYDVNKLDFKKAFPGGFIDLERCAVMYEYVLSGKCTSLEGNNGAYALMKSDVKNKRIDTKIEDELLESQEEVKDSHPVLYEALVYINNRIKRIQESNDEILNEYISRYGTQTPNERIIKGLYEKTECYAFVQECWKKKQDYEDWRIKLTGKTYSKKKKRWIDY